MSEHDKRDKEVDDYFEKFGEGYSIPIFQAYTWDEVKKDIRRRIDENDPQPGWDPESGWVM